jgi:hypothetical protein
MFFAQISPTNQFDIFVEKDYHSSKYFIPNNIARKLMESDPLSKKDFYQKYDDDDDEAMHLYVPNYLAQVKNSLTDSFDCMDSKKLMPDPIHELMRLFG